MASESEIELKPCPFCGWEAEMKYDLCNGYYVHCEHCNAYNGFCTEKEDAVSAWNRRAE